MAAAGFSEWIAVIGDRLPHFNAQASIHDAVAHSAQELGVAQPELRWIGTDVLAEEGVDQLSGAAGVWCAPGSPYRSLEGALSGIRWAREAHVPFLGTCAGFQHGVIEFARNVLGNEHAAHAEYGVGDNDDDLFIDELSCSLVGQRMDVGLIDDVVAGYYGSPTSSEQYYCRFGLTPAWRRPLEAAGLLVAGVDARDEDVRIMRLDRHAFFVLTLFVPQGSSTTSSPHPLVSAFLSACTSRHGVRADR